MKRNTFEIVLPAEWAPQSAVLLTWPHAQTDWLPILDEVIPCFVSIAKEIIKHERLIIVCADKESVKNQLGNVDYSRIRFRELMSNDSWARDHGPISVLVNDVPYVLDFMFNGWGMKFPANYDNQITKQLFHSDAFSPETGYQSMLHMVLEGGSIESDGEGTILTTSECLLSANRNEDKSKAEIEDYLKMIFDMKQVLWLDNGYLAGDDTDSHIDTLARFCSRDTIAYVRCDDPEDEHYHELQLMEEQLRRFRTLDNQPYRLLPLPMAEAVYYEEERLPATYANFLIINGAVLVPTYGTNKDEEAMKVLKEAFPDRKIVGINCLPLIIQHGSLHCVTMQFPAGFVK